MKNKKLLAATVSEEIIEEIKKLAKAQHRSVSSMVNLLLLFALSNK